MSVLQSLSNPKYRRATYTCIFLMTSNVLTGLSAILIYSTKIFSNLREKGELPLTEFEASAIVGAVTLLFSGVAYFLAKYFKYKP